VLPAARPLRPVGVEETQTQTQTQTQTSPFTLNSPDSPRLVTRRHRHLPKLLDGMPLHDRDDTGGEHPQTIAVALHGIEPATFERCALIRDWLDDHGIDRVTLLVIPARDLHPVGERSPEMVQWLSERRLAGDAIAQHGFRHLQLRRASSPRDLLARTRRGSGAAEFARLDSGETRRAVEAGWRVLKLAGIEPDGFVAPAYAYTPTLRQTVSVRFRWWAELMRLHRSPPHAESSTHGPLAPAWSLARSGPVRRLLSPTLIRVGARLPTSTLRLDLSPDDLSHPRHIMALERLLARAGTRRTAVTYQELAMRYSEAVPDSTVAPNELTPFRPA
jgi:predicted deacetylase